MRDDWPKMSKLRHGLTSLFRQQQWQQNDLLQLLNDAETFEQTLLPSTGIPLTTEHQLSSPFVLPFHINGRSYGTRSSCVMRVNQQGQVGLLEKQHLPDDKGVRHLNFTIQLDG